MAKTLILIFLK